MRMHVLILVDVSLSPDALHPDQKLECFIAQDFYIVCGRF